MTAQNGGNLFAKRVLEVLHSSEVQHFGEVRPTCKTGRHCHKIVRRAHCSQRCRDRDERQLSHLRRLTHFHTIAQSSEQIGKRGKLREVQVQNTGAQNECTYGFWISLLL